ncbi:FadR/GntR family transcriptional regulator [Azospirillum picis]|uniref:GntR family transcriptional repressor for pyruvate dehydrogenase complex n=1 Tax=Azospirillum picis TaxID=488438 RepID=A0ABU0MLX7_9PROT|nr:FCD domain-containing protein [Azospirillum picis]MBP2300505.1 GntR family transcriptional repressor for pyruvate dehydrogenase complex [Azospirillum picis]MDQ0534474.1 GntR family transcriptional repressor for pyruvate dehydrogenase complex [Azospirillum picis]
MRGRLLVPQAAVARIRQIIDEQGLRPGDQLPPQRELAERLSISRASLREALSALETLGLIRIEVGRGVFLTDGKPPDPVATWRFADLYSPREVYEARLALEPQAAQLAAASLPAAGLGALASTLVRMRAAFEAHDLAQAGVEDSTFHRLIVEGCGNRMFTDLFRTVDAVVAEIQRLPFAREDRIWETLDEHERILEALRMRDGGRAAQAMSDHISGAAGRLGIGLGTGAGAVREDLELPVGHPGR